MKTIILCGGKGTRLSEETKFVPYMPEAKREDLMTSLLLPQDAPDTATDANTAADAAIDKKMNSDNATPAETPVA